MDQLTYLKFRCEEVTQGRDLFQNSFMESQVIIEKQKEAIKSLSEMKDISNIMNQRYESHISVLEDNIYAQELTIKKQKNKTTIALIGGVVITTLLTSVIIMR